MTEEINKKIALVTGASRGIGKACALELAKAGYNVVINYVGNEEAANQTVAELTALGVEAYAARFDVTNKETVDKGVAEVIEKFGRIDVLVNNAGITRDGLFMRMSAENWEAVINTNLNSAFYVTSPVAKLMIKQRSGAIINMASISGVYGNAGQANYSAAKAGLIGMTKALAKELASRGIRVNAVAPGFIETDMTKDLKLDGIVDHIPLKRLGQVSDIAKTVKFLAEDAPYITGQVIQVDGGLVI
jgi:3-oxoacyl-[acyl-carrier protein] reductase